MKYLLSGYYGGGNFGDDLLLNSLEKLIRENDESAAITIVSHNKKLTMKEKNDCKSIVSPLFNKYWFRTSIFYYFWHMRSIDVIIIGGGQIFQDNVTWNFLGKQLFLASIAKFLNKKVILFGIGAERLKLPDSRRLFDLAKNSIDYIVTRDNNSYSILKDYFPNERVFEGSDIVTNNFVIDRISGSKNEFIIINIRSYNFPKEKLSILANLINAYCSNEKLILLGTEDDEIILSELKDLLSDDFGSVSLVSFISIKEYEGIIKKAKLVISMRFHFIVLSMIFGKKCLALSYDPKVSSFCERLNIPFVKTKDFTLKKIISSYSESIKEDIIVKKNRFNILSDMKTRNEELFSKVLSYKKKILSFKEKLFLIFSFFLFYRLLLRDLFRKD